MTLIVSDTGPVLHLHEAGILGLLQLPRQVYIPQKVRAEVSSHIPSWQAPSWLTVETLIEPYASEATTWTQAGLLDAGEAYAIALARQLQADWLLTDDTAARLMAQTLKLEVHGTLGVVLWAAAEGHLSLSDAEIAL